MDIGPRSFWQAKYGTYQPNAPLQGLTEADVAIVGGGFTGLTVAREYLRDNPAARVVVVEAEDVGFGASGRNGGFNMTLFGVEPEITVMRWGRERTRQAQAYMQRAVGYVRTLIAQERLDSDYVHSGMWRVAYTDTQLKRLEGTLDLVSSLSPPGSFSFIEGGRIAEHLATERMRGAIVEPDTGILDPCKHVRELKRLAEARGARIHERTLVTRISRRYGGVTIDCVDGQIRADKLVMATNAWSHRIEGLPRLKSRQRPCWTYQIVTDPLTPQEWASIGWRERQSIEDNRHLVHYSRVTQCGRITMGGGDVHCAFGKKMDHDSSPVIWSQLEAHLRWLFPQLQNKLVHYRWGGPVSVNLDMTPEIGFIGDDRVIYATGCQGHGVSLTQLNGRLIADLLSERQTDLTDFWIVNRKAIPFPGEPLAYLGQRVVTGALRAIDRFQERGLQA